MTVPRKHQIVDDADAAGGPEGLNGPGIGGCCGFHKMQRQHLGLRLGPDQGCGKLMEARQRTRSGSPSLSCATWSLEEIYLFYLPAYQRI